MFTGFESSDDLIKHLDERMKVNPSFTREGYGLVWNIGHEIPRVYYDATKIEDLKRCHSKLNIFCDNVVNSADARSNSSKNCEFPTTERLLELRSVWPLWWDNILPTEQQRSTFYNLARRGLMNYAPPKRPCTRTESDP